jgi:glycosyltransferase involved in cell wall biosynthesis
VTFINPHFVKGVYIFARIARELARRRPDIPILVTQGRSRADALMAPELGLAPHLAGQFPAEPVCDGRNITLMPFMPDPRTFYPTVYSLTRLLITPSLWNESFGLVAAEAMLNGIPVLASNRGALAETVGGSGSFPEADGTRSARSVPATMCGPGGFLFDIPAKYTPEMREVPPAEEVEPWVETIIRLWDDSAEYERRSQAAREHAQRWHPERLAPIYRQFFSSLCHQPGPPLVPREVAS